MASELAAVDGEASPREALGEKTHFDRRAAEAVDQEDAGVASLVVDGAIDDLGLG
jgi:hypothetical protein